MKRKRILRMAVLALLIAALTIPHGSARYMSRFRFGLREAGVEAIPAVVYTGGFDIVFSPNHLFVSGQTHTLSNLREGYYAFIIRGGDGGVGRQSGGFCGFGGAGGIVMGYVWLPGGSSLYVTVGRAGRGWNADSNLNTNNPSDGTGRSAFGNGGAWISHNESWPASGGGGGGATWLRSSSGAVGMTHGGQANLIAVAGGGGGGGGLSGTGGAWHGNLEARGGDAGGSGHMGYSTAQSNTNNIHNSILNGAGWRHGFQGGNPTSANSSTNSSAGNNNSGGGGSNSQGGARGSTANVGTAGGALTGGRANNERGGGGGSGFFGGGGGAYFGNWGGGGGGGSSWAHSSVQPLTGSFTAHDFFRDFIDGVTGATDHTIANDSSGRHLTGAFAAPGRIRKSVGNPTSGTINLSFPDDTGGWYNNGWSGFAFIKYLGPTNPVAADGTPIWNAGNTFGSWPFV